MPHGSQHPRSGKKYHHQPSVFQLATSAATCHLCALLLETLNNKRHGGSIDYAFQDDPLLMVLFTDEDLVYKYLKMRCLLLLSVDTSLLVAASHGQLLGYFWGKLDH
jgi:hypothetical protein